jgi:hypothetical protein
LYSEKYDSKAPNQRARSCCREVYRIYSKLETPFHKEGDVTLKIRNSNKILCRRGEQSEMGSLPSGYLLVKNNPSMGHPPLYFHCKFFAFIFMFKVINAILHKPFFYKHRRFIKENYM